jgi:CTP:molybdopterin cytidylyltransferase MocA
MNTRRLTLRSLLAAISLGWLLLRTAAAANQDAARTLLLEDEPAAKAIAYVAAAGKVNTTANPTYRRGQSCTTCAFVERSTAKQRGCTLVPGRVVMAAGWCKLWKLTGSA